MIVRDPLRGWAEIYFNDLGWFGFQKFYVMTSTEIDLYDIVHVKAHIFPVPKMWILAILGKFVWTTHFVQCGLKYIFLPFQKKFWDFRLINSNIDSLEIRSFWGSVVWSIYKTFLKTAIQIIMVFQDSFWKSMKNCTLVVVFSPVINIDVFGYLSRYTGSAIQINRNSTA